MITPAIIGYFFVLRIRIVAAKTGVDIEEWVKSTIF